MVERPRRASRSRALKHWAVDIGFERLFAQEGRDWPRFHAAVAQLAALPAAERDAYLKRLSSG